MRVLAWTLGTLIALTSAAGCSPVLAGTPVAIRVTPQHSLEDQQVKFVVTGLQPGLAVSLTVTSTDARGFDWKSTSLYRASSSGRVDTSTSAAVSGSYTGVSPSGPIWSMTTSRHDPNGVYVGAPSAMAFRVTVIAGATQLASTTFDRQFQPQHGSSLSVQLADGGFVGEYVAPDPKIPTHHVGVLMFGGSEGGPPGRLLPELLAAHGYSVLSIAYFRVPGLPQSLANIPLEYFVGALRWLDRRPGVDPQRTVVWGVSRGSEAALLLGAHYPDLVHGVVALVPSNAVNCALPDCQGSAWTLGGKPLPYARADGPDATDNAAAAIPVEQIRGPVFLDCAGLDELWTSCPYADAIMARLDRNHDAYPHVLYRYPDAGHGIGFVLPYWPVAFPDVDAHYVANQSGRTDQWPRILTFLAGA